MPFSRIAKSEHLVILKQVLEQYCASRGITGKQDRNEIALSILRLFDNGLNTSEEIAAALANISARADGRPSIALVSQGALHGQEMTSPSQST